MAMHCRSCGYDLEPDGVMVVIGDGPYYRCPGCLGLFGNQLPIYDDKLHCDICGRDTDIPIDDIIQDNRTKDAKLLFHAGDYCFDDYADLNFASVIADFGHGSSFAKENHHCRMCEFCYYQLRFKIIDEMGGKITRTVVTECPIVDVPTIANEDKPVVPSKPPLISDKVLSIIVVIMIFTIVWALGVAAGFMLS